MRPLIALLTDFGLRDHYVGVMKGVIAGICPDASLIDIAHDIPPQDVMAGALELAAAYRYFPAGTIFLSVVDPGVGTTRRAIAARAGDYRFVTPDNGLVSLAIGDTEIAAYELTNSRYSLARISRTFEGRDRFAPAAAWLATGIDPSEFGPRVPSIHRIDVPAIRTMAEAIEGEVVRVDRFGNLITNIPVGALDQFSNGSPLEVVVAGRTTAPVSSTYSAIDRASLGALVGSTGHLEVSLNGGSAAAALGCGRGTAVRVSRRA